jgi:glycosyltransferase involved in cell wall biosynthesis
VKARPVVLLLGPSREAISGVSTHLNLLLPAETLAREFDLAHFQVGSEGRSEGPLRRWLRLAADPIRLAAAILRHDAGLVHVNTSLNARAYWRDIVYVAVAKLLGSRVLYQVHGGQLPQNFLGGGRLAGALLRFTLRLPDVVVVLASVELDAYRAFLPGQPVALVPNGIDCERFLRNNRAAAEPQAPLRLAFIGRLAREKGVFEILEAMRLAREKGVAARLLVAGGGPDEQSLRQRVHELALEREVTFVGVLDEQGKAQLLGRCDVLLLPSYSEGLPYALLEAMAAGAVPVVTPVGAMPDVVIEGLHGLFVPVADAQALADAIGSLAADRASLARMRAACRARVAAAFSIGRVADDLRALYSTLLKHHVRNRRLGRSPT